MLRAIGAMLFYLDRWLDEEKAKRDALSYMRKNHWRCVEVERMRQGKEFRSYRRAKNGYYCGR